MRSRAYLHKYLHKYTHTQTRIEQLQMRQHFALQAYICICTYVSKHVSMSACMLADLPSLYVVGTLTATASAKAKAKASATAIATTHCLHYCCRCRRCRCRCILPSLWLLPI